MGEAFQLNQLNHDQIPDTPKRLRTRNARIIQLCDWARTSSTIASRPSPSPSSARRAPEIIAGIRADVVRARAHPAPRRLARVHAYAPAAAAPDRGTPPRPRSCFEFATHGADVSTARRENGQREQANLALETAIEAGAARRPCSTPSTRSRSRRCAPNRRSMPSSRIPRRPRAARDLQHPAVGAAMTTLEQELAPSPGRGEARPVRRTHAAARGERRSGRRGREGSYPSGQPVPPEGARPPRDRRRRPPARVARSVISGHRGWIGADARTRLAEAERIRLDLAALPHNPSARTTASRPSPTRAAADSLPEALQLAQRDIDSSPERRRLGRWGRLGRRRRGEAEATWSAASSAAW
jgi:hypothetical protein